MYRIVSYTGFLCILNYIHSSILHNEFSTWTILYTAPYSAHIMNTHHCHCRDLCLGHQWAHRRSCRGSSCWDTPGSPRAAGCRGSCTGCSCSSSCCGSGSGSCYTPSPPGTAAVISHMFYDAQNGWRGVNVHLAKCLNSVLNVKALTTRRRP